MFYTGDLYPEKRVDVSSVHITGVFEITTELENNPQMIAMKAMGSNVDADLLWMTNHITEPYKQLKAGMILKIPSIADIYDESTMNSAVNQKVNLKSARVSGSTIIF